MNRGDVSQALAAGLAAVTDKLVGVRKVPDLPTGMTYKDLLDQGYYILNPVPGPPGEGAYDGSWTITNCVYQVNSVGSNDDHAELLAKWARDDFFLNPATVVTSNELVDANTAIMRMTPNTPAQTPSEPSDGLVSIVERFTVSVTDH